MRSTMSRPDPIEYAERLYGAIRDANFSPISFLAFGNSVKEGVPMRRLPRIAAEPFMRVVGEMLDLEEEAAEEDGILDLDLAEPASPEPAPAAAPPAAAVPAEPPPVADVAPAEPVGSPEVTSSAAPSDGEVAPAPAGERRRNGRR